MRVETQKVIFLTKEEKEIISQLYDILNDDNDLDLASAWDIFAAVRDNDNILAREHDYAIVITD
jgi:hypothetical protein